MASASWIWPWAIASVIIFLGLFVYGWKDLIRTHWQRVWAISGVCVTESLRKKVLWLTPFAMAGIVVVSQFQVTADFQDATRQTTKFCLFASALLVIVTAIILACTNLPREIESRVIFTIVTKPTTRLEIILGKVLGYARVSGLLILIMGAFTLAYLQFRVRPMIAELKSKLETLPSDSPLRSTDEYYVNSGLLGTRSMEWGGDVEVYAEPPYGPEKWSLGGVAQYILLPFSLTAKQREIMAAVADAPDKAAPTFLTISLDIKRHEPSAKERQEARDAKLEEPSKAIKAPDTFDVPSPIPLPATKPSTPTTQPEALPLIPQVQVRFLDEAHALLVRMDETNAGELLVLSPRKPGDPYSGSMPVPMDVLKRASEVGKFYVQVTTRTPAMEFGVRGFAAFISVPIAGQPPIQMAADPDHADQPAPAIFGGYPIREGIRLTPVRQWADGSVDGPVAAFHFHDTNVKPGKDGKVGVQIGVAVERAGDIKEDPDHPVGYATATLQVVNLTTGERSEPITFAPQTSRTQPVGVDAKYLKGGNFDILLRGTTQGQNLGIFSGENGAVALVTADHVFFLNLVKSLFILWLLSLLVVIIAVFCSTFVSWPIAVVLTLVILLSHWGVEQLGGALNYGVAGRTTATQMGIRDPSTSEIVAGTVDKLSYGLKLLSNVLPDVSAFPVMEDIELGVSIPPAKVFGALGVIFCYGLPMLVFSYVILRRKEVAP